MNIRSHRFLNETTQTGPIMSSLIRLEQHLGKYSGRTKYPNHKNYYVANTTLAPDAIMSTRYSVDTSYTGICTRHPSPQEEATITTAQTG